MESHSLPGSLALTKVKAPTSAPAKANQLDRQPFGSLNTAEGNGRSTPRGRNSSTTARIGHRVCRVLGRTRREAALPGEDVSEGKELLRLFDAFKLIDRLIMNDEDLGLEPMTRTTSRRTDMITRRKFFSGAAACLAHPLWPNASLAEQLLAAQNPERHRPAGR